MTPTSFRYYATAIWLGLFLVCYLGYMKAFYHSQSPQTILAEPYISLLQDLQHRVWDPLIVDLRFVKDSPDSSQTCPEPYTHLSLGEWKGLTTGCQCPGKELIKGSCSNYNLTECTTITEVSSTKFDRWVSNYLVCARHAANPVFKSRLENCPNSTRACSPNTCIGIDQPCPLAEVKMISRIEKVPKEFEVLQGSKDRLKNEDGRIFVTVGRRGSLNNKEDNLINGLRVSLNGPPCLDQMHMPTRRGLRKFTLEKTIPDDCAGANKYFRGDLSKELSPMQSVSERHVLQANDIWNSTPAPYQMFVQGAKDNYVLYSSPKVLLNRSDPLCANFKPYDQAQASYVAYSASLGNLGTCLVILSLIGFPTMLFIIAQYIKRPAYKDTYVSYGLGALLTAMCLVLIVQYFIGTAALEVYKANQETFLHNCVLNPLYQEPLRGYSTTQVNSGWDTQETMLRLMALAGLAFGGITVALLVIQKRSTRDESYTTFV
eukprot:TRINITY_DN6856_c0_g1_i2.p1 TRINITY_DN6856_c0_g1~~TRINITY_DN6856_c0_g1_i2.p1  ORF type:complete len:488 (-),score=17.90 TRINITY_DN6856_c0_g1_i2:4-1467(-)